MKSKLKLMVLALASLAGCTGRGVTVRMANEKTATTRSAQHWKRRASDAMGKPEMAEANDDDVDAALDDHMKAIAAEPAEPVKVVKTENAKVEEGKETVTTENAELVEARQEAVKLLLDNAVTEGKVPAADRPSWEERFTKDYSKTKVELANAKAVIKTTAVTAGRGADNGAALTDESSRREKVHSLVNEKMEKNNMTYDNAYLSVTREHPALFSAMTQPEKSKK